MDSDHTIAAEFLAHASRRMHDCRDAIATCCDQLTETQMGHRGGDHENSVVNLLLHLDGNVRQWILHGVAGHADVRERDAEFSLRPTDARTARARFTATVNEAAAVVASLPPARLLEITDPQPTGTWRKCTILVAIFRVVAHLDHHTGQIILLTKQLAAKDLDLSMPRKR